MKLPIHGNKIVTYVWTALYRKEKTILETVVKEHIHDMKVGDLLNNTEPAVSPTMKRKKNSTKSKLTKEAVRPRSSYEDDFKPMVEVLGVFV